MPLVQPMPPKRRVVEQHDTFVSIEKAFDDMMANKKERKRQEHIDAMLAEWRRENGYCPHCGEKL